MMMTHDSTFQASLLPTLPLCALLFGACAMGEELDGNSRGGPAEDPTTDAMGATTGATTGAEEQADQDDGGALASEVQVILGAKCVDCHGPGSTAQGGMDYVNDLTALVANGKVVPGKPEESPIFIRTSTGQMPPPSTGTVLAPEEVETLRQWILAGAPSPPLIGDCTDNPKITVDDMILAMNIDISRRESADKPFIRYLTLTHLYNTGACPDELEVYQYAVAKLLNSLSQNPVIMTPEVVDDAGTILAFDIRDLDWDANVTLTDVWEATVQANDFAVQYVQEFADELVEETTTATPFQAADSFLQIVTRGQLYYDILGIPENPADLEKFLGVNREADLAAGEAVRTAFAESGVSNFNRAFDRYVIPSANNRAYYRSFDFDNEGDDANVFVTPIDFVPAGGEIIYNLPNGMQAYMLVNGVGLRINEAVTTIVKDPNQRDFIVKNGISCMSCHSGGIIPKDDEVGPYVELFENLFPAGVVDQVEDIYADKATRNKQQAQDAQSFLTALVAAGVPTAAAEPIITVSLDFERNLDLKRAAAEFGVSEDELRVNIIDLVGLQPLLVGKVSREVFTEHFQENICALRPGDDVRPACAVPG